MFGRFSSFLYVLSCWCLIARRYWKANNVQCGTLKINPVSERSKLLAMKRRLFQCASIKQTWNQASLIFMLNIRVVRKRAEGGETTMMVQKWINTMGRKWMGETLKVHSAQVISTVKNGLCVEQSTSMRARHKATSFSGENNSARFREPGFQWISLWYFSAL